MFKDNPHMVAQELAQMTAGAKQSRGPNLAEELQEQNKRIHHQLSRLNNLADRVFGANQPEPATLTGVNGAMVSPPPSLVNELRRVEDHVHRLSELVERLENIN